MVLQIALAERGLSTSEVIKALTLDPHQSRLSLGPHIYLTHPTLRKTAILSEYADTYLTSPRFAIETSDSLIFISKVGFGEMQGLYIIAKVVTKSEIKRMISDEELCPKE